jgi:hypothetical protein
MEKTLTIDENTFLLKSLEKLYIKKNNLKQFDSINFDYENSSINRYIKLIDIHNNIKISKVNTVYTVLKLERGSESINYAYVYGVIENNKVVNNFLITSNSLISKDGMYSHRLITFDKIYGPVKNSKLINEIYDFIAVNIKNGEFKLIFDVFNISENKIKNSYINDLKKSTLLVYIFIIPWIVELYNMYRSDQEINMNPNYNEIMFNDKDKNKFAEIYKTSSKEIYDLAIYYKFLTHDSKNRLELGQKLIPFNYIQLKEYNNIVHFQWKELLVNKIITNLLYNINSPCFSIFVDWLLIKNSNRDLYDNKTIYNKILYSDKIKNILTLLNKANVEFLDIYSKQRNEFIDSLIKKLKKIIKLSENKILMSNISLCYISEYSGKTIYDYYTKIKDPNKIHKNIGNIFEDFGMFQKYTFEIIYSLYCLNLRGIIHGDLHLNNVTLNKKNLNVKENNYVIYNLNSNKNEHSIDYINKTSSSDEYINDEYIDNDNVNVGIDTNNDHIYMFKHMGTYPCIIDFSRSFILLKLIDENIIEKNKNIIRMKYIKNEQNRIMSELKKLFPNFIKNNSHKLKFLFKNKNFNTLFLYFSAFDIFKFASNLLIFINKYSSTNNITVNVEITNLLTNISKRAYQFLEKIIDEESYNNINELKFPNFVIIEEFFSSAKISEKELKNKFKTSMISDIFNIDNIDQNYSITEIINELNTTINKEIINIENNKNKDEIKKLDIINKKLHNFINFSKKNEDLEIEQLINNEYYNIKTNLSLITSSNFNTDTSSSEFTVNDY